jgi:hypothetical protein
MGGSFYLCKQWRVVNIHESIFYRGGGDLMKRHFITYVTIVLCITCFGKNDSFAQKALYDDFSGTYIDYQRWYEGEFVREIVAGKLVSKVRNGATNEDARNRTAFQIPSSISVIKCDITVVATNLDTGTNPMSFTRVDGRFYNTLNSGTERGDIWAGLYIGDRGSGLEVWWEVYESLDDAGNSWEEKGSGTLVVPGLAYGNSYTATLEYDGANGFTFSVAGVSDSFAGPARQGAEFTTYKALETGAYSDGGSGTGYTSASFDNVYINNQVTAYDTFDAAPLDLTKWRQLEFVREISGGSLRANIQGIDQMSQVSIPFTKQDASFLEARVRLESASQLSQGARGIARIQGYYYNDSRGPGSGLPHNGYEGNVFVQIRLQYDSDRSLKAITAVGRYNDANETDYTDLLYQVFTTPIYFDTFYTLSIQFTGTELIFRCNGEQITYPITTPTYKPYGEQRKLRTRLYLDPGESGYMKALFDDVYVDADLVADFAADVTSGPVPLSVNFTDQSTGDISSWSWDFGDGSTSTEQNPAHTYTEPGTYTVTLTVTGPEGSDTETKTDYINVRSPGKAMPWIPLLLLDD